MAQEYFLELCRRRGSKTSAAISTHAQALAMQALAMQHDVYATGTEVGVGKTSRKRCFQRASRSSFCKVAL